jgi:tetratricopeptide (TPR) repeat protein
MAKIIPISPTKYIMTKGRSLPLYECYISKEWKEMGIANVFVSRKQPSGNITYSVFLVDLFCLGVKSAHYEFNISHQDFFEIITKGNEGGDMLIKCDYDLAHNIIYGALAYADDIGFNPHKDFSIAQYLLEEDTEDIPLIDIEFGRNGKPYLIIHQMSGSEHLLKRLDAKVGKGNYDFLIEVPPEDNDFINEEEEYNDEDETEEDSVDEETEKFYSFIDFLYDEEFKRERVATTSSGEVIPIEYEITDESIESCDLPIGREEEERLHQMLNDDPANAIPHYEKLVQQHPHIPVLYNHLMCAYQKTGKNKQAENLIVETYRKFPNYLFGRINYANMLIQKGKIPEVPQIFHSKYELSLLYPDRKKFHFTEVVAFYATMAHYFTAIDELHRASTYMGLLDAMDLDIFSNPLIETVAQKLHKKKLDKLMASGFLDKAKNRMSNFLASVNKKSNVSKWEE